MPEKETDTYYPASLADWQQWLEKNHHSRQFVWLVFYNKKSKIGNISWSDAVDVALRFGWIDSKKQKIDEFSYRQFYSKRKPTSTWSKINKQKVQQLIANGKMTPAGYKSIETAKQNGSWSVLDEVEALVIPEDLKIALDNHTESLKYFDNLSKSDKKILLHWVTFAKKPETRQKRIIVIAESARHGMKPKQFR